MPVFGKQVLIAAVMASALAAGNFGLAHRDGSLTHGIGSFETREIILGKLWSEHPMQVINTFMPGAAFFGAGDPGKRGVPFATRLVNRFGTGRVDQRAGPVDLRGVLPEADLEILQSFVFTHSYRSLDACAHDPRDLCTYAVGWNRERTKDSGVLMIFVRVSDDTYLLSDDSILGFGP